MGNDLHCCQSRESGGFEKDKPEPIVDINKTVHDIHIFEK